MALRFSKELRTIERKLKDAETEAGRLAKRAKEINDNMPDILNPMLAQLAQNELLVMVQNFLVDNLKKSGIKKRTGRLESAVEDSIVDAYITDAGKFIVKARMRDDEQDYDYSGDSTKGGRDNGSNFYKVAQSLNDGSVRAPREFREKIDLPNASQFFTEKQSNVRTVIGAKKKRAVKRKAHGKAISRRKKLALERDRKFALRLKGEPDAAHIKKGLGKLGEFGKVDKTLRMQVAGGTVIVTPAKPYYFFAGAQTTAINDLITTAVTKRLQEYMNSRS